MCLVELAIDIVQTAIQLGANKPNEPLGVFQSDDGDTVYFTGDQITKYYRYVKQ